MPDFKTLITNAVTVSFRLEYLGDLTTVLTILTKLSADGVVIDFRTHLNKGNIPIVEPFVEFTTTKEALDIIVKAMSDPTLDLHVGLDTMRRLPMEQNPMQRDYGSGEFSKFRN